MKTTKRIFACLLIVVMLASMLCVGAGAANITINGVDGVTYTVYKVFDTEGTSKDAVLYTWPAGTTDAQKAAVNSYISETNGYISITGSVIEFANAVATSGAYTSPVANVTLSGSSTTVDLADGYYVMKNSANTAVNAFSVINGKVDDGTTHTYTATAITAKGTLPEITKTVNGIETDVVGSHETLNYTVTVAAEGNGKNYTVVDKLPAGITYSGSVAVKVDSTNLDSPADYTATYDAGNHTLTVAFTNTYLASIAAGTNIDITYTATLTNAANIADATHTNTATLYYGDDGSDAGDLGDLTKTDSASVNTYKLTVTKYIKDTTTPLANATFKLANAAGTEFAVVDTSTKVITDWTATGTPLTTPADGVITFIGLDNGSYTLIETDAPAGYIVAANQTVTISGANATATVYNTPGNPLPETGGMGTTVFYAVGGCLVLGALVILLMKKRTVA